MDKPNNYYPKKTIYLIHYPNGQKVEFSSGVIKNIFEDNYTITHLCTTKTGSSGGPLINIINHKVIGLHKGSKNSHNFNLGTLFKIPIQKFNQKYNNNMNSQFKMKNNNFIKNTNNNNSNKNMNYNNNIQNINIKSYQNLNIINNKNQNKNLINNYSNQNMNIKNNNINKNINFNNNNINQNMNFNNNNNQNMNNINNNQNKMFNINNGNQNMNLNINFQNMNLSNNNQNMKLNNNYQNMNFINNNQNMNLNNIQNMNFNNIPFMGFNNNQNMNFNNNIPFVNFNYNQMISNNIPFMNFNNNQNIDFNNINFMNFNNNQNMNINYSPFMNFNNISNLNFNNPDMNFNPSQISQNIIQMNNSFNMGKPNNSNDEKSKNLYPYIKGERKEIIFVNSKNKINIVKIPISLRKNDIYSIAENYKSSFYYEIKKLIHNNKILENDDSSIDCILNGDSIKIIEFLDDCDLAYHDSVLLKHKKSEYKKMINIYFEDLYNQRTNIHFPEDVTGIEIKKSYCSKKEIPFKYLKDFIFLCSATELSDDEIISNYSTIVVHERNAIVGKSFYTDGKRICASIYYNDSKKSIPGVYFGTLNQIKDFYERIKYYYFYNEKGKGIIYPGGIEVKENDERAFSEIGIRDDFICRWITNKKQYN